MFCIYQLCFAICHMYYSSIFFLIVIKLLLHHPHTSKVSPGNIYMNETQIIFFILYNTIYFSKHVISVIGFRNKILVSWKIYIYLANEVCRSLIIYLRHHWIYQLVPASDLNIGMIYYYYVNITFKWFQTCWTKYSGSLLKNKGNNII